MTKLTYANVKAALKLRGVTVNPNDWNEYRVNLAGASEDSAAYVSRSGDRLEVLQEVLDTGNAMADWQDRARGRMPAPEPVAPVAPESPRKRYRLGSSPLIHAPGIIAWAINGYAFKKDRKAIEAVVSEGWSLPIEACRALLSKAVPHTIDGETVVFEVPA